MLTKVLSYLSDFFILLFVFSILNDNFTVDHFGEISLKILFLLFFVFYFPSMLHNLKTMTSSQDKLFFAFFLTNLFVFLLINIINPINDFMLPSMLLLASFAIVVYFSRSSLQKTLYFIWISMMLSVIICYYNQPLSEWSFRKSGGTGDPNEFATQLLAFLFAAFYLYTHNKSKIFLTLSIIFFTYGIFRAGSMSSFLVLGVVIIFSLTRMTITNPKLLINYKVFLGLCVLIGLSTQLNISKFEAINNMLNRTKDTQTAKFRMHSWLAGLHMIEDNIIIGVGVNQFANNTHKYEESFLARSRPEAHNVYIKLLAESGIIVFTLFVFFILSLISSHFKKLFYSSDWLLLSILISTLLMGMTLSLTYDKYFWLFIAIMMNLNYQLNRRRHIT